MNSTLEDYLVRSQKVLDASLSNANTPDRLLQAMRYTTLLGGKRIRALLVYASGFAVDAPMNRLDAVAAAIECIHSYSLIHDDLPAMDDDDLRRGQASNHIHFDEATAILAGDALQTLAFELINAPDSGLSDLQARTISHTLAVSGGESGMVGGQVLDILATGKQLTRAQLENMHRRKTGALIKASVVCGALCADTLHGSTKASLERYADNIGLAFQVMDDVLDIESSTEQLGKNSGSDQAQGKSTYPELMGLEESKKLAQTLYQEAVVSIASIGDNTQHLIEIADLVVNRIS